MSSDTLPLPQAGADARAADQSVRDPFLDNAKFLLVVLVAVGHSWGPTAGGARWLLAAYLFVYAFHMPAFAFICGHFSRHFTGTPEQIRRLVTRVLVPYLVFETLYSALYAVLRDQPFTLTLTRPSYLCWFLLALFLWRLSAPLWRAVRYPVALSVVISLAAGLTGPDYELALPRVLMFLPWFVLGLRTGREQLRPLRGPVARRWALPVLVCCAAGAWWVAPRVGAGWVLMKYGAEDLGTGPAAYLAVRLGLFAVSALLLGAFLALVPGRRTALTLLGAFTLYPYLLHGLVIKSLDEAGWFDRVFAAGPLAVLAATLGAAGLAVLLSAPPVRRVFRPLVEPRMPRFLVPRGKEPAGPPNSG